MQIGRALAICKSFVMLDRCFEFTGANATNKQVYADKCMWRCRLGKWIHHLYMLLMNNRLTFHSAVVAEFSLAHLDACRTVSKRDRVFRLTCPFPPASVIGPASRRVAVWSGSASVPGCILRGPMPVDIGSRPTAQGVWVSSSVQQRESRGEEPRGRRRPRRAGHSDLRPRPAAGARGHQRSAGHVSVSLR